MASWYLRLGRGERVDRVWAAAKAGMLLLYARKACSAMALLLACALPAWAEPVSPGGAPVVMRVEGAPRPGGALFVTVSNAGDGDTLALRWLDNAYPLAAEGSVLRAVLPVPRATKPGTYVLALTGSEGALVERAVPLKKVNYGDQSIWLPPAMLATYDSARAKADDRLLLDAAKKYTPERYWRGPFRSPADGPLSTRYGQARTYNGWRKGWHKGLDVAAGSGAPIRAPGGAVVAVVAPRQLVNGNATLLDHGIGVYSLYLHQSRIGVTVAQKVAAGRRIGQVGSTGAGTGPHLHWACYVHGVPIDPQVLMHAPW